jgi:hypothetical protein
MTTNSKLSIKFHVEPCTRCGGTGTYPSPAWEGRCLGCSGKGYKLTAAAARARKIYDDLCHTMTTTWANVKIGDRVFVDHKYWVIVDSIEPTESISTLDGPQDRILVSGHYLLRPDREYVVNTSLEFDVRVYQRDVFIAAVRRVAGMKDVTVTGLEDESPVAAAPPARRTSTSHSSCSHPSTPAARRVCRASR